MKRWLRLAWQVFSLLLFVVVLVVGGPQAWEQIRSGDWRFIVIACLLLGVTTFLSATRFQTIARSLSRRHLASWRHFYQVNMTTRALGLVVPRSLSTIGGKSVALRAMNVPLKRGVWIVLMDNMLDLAMLGILAIPALFFLRNGGPIWAFALTMMGLLAAMGWGLWWLTSSGRLRTLILWPMRFPRIASSLRLDPDTAKDIVLPSRAALAAFGMTFLLNGTLTVCFYFVARAVGLEYPWFVFAAGFPVTQLSLVLAVTPGGLGLFDASWYGVLRLGGILHEEAITFVIAQRAYVFIFVLIWTGFSLILSLFRKKVDQRSR